MADGRKRLRADAPEPLSQAKKCVQFYMTQDEYARLYAIAEREETSVAETLRRLIARDKA